MRFHGQSARIEFVADRMTGNVTPDYCCKENGPGVMVIESAPQNRHYVLDTENPEDLVLVARKA